MILIRYLFCVLLLLGLCFYLWKQSQEAPLRRLYWPALLLRLLCGVAIGLLYTHYYHGGDTWEFQRQSEKLTEYAKITPVPYIKVLLWNEFVDDGLRESLHYTPFLKSFWLIKLLSVFNFFTHSNYYLNGLLLSFFSFSGSWFLANTLARQWPQARLGTALGLLFWPSVVFFASGVTKESLLMGSIGFFLGLLLLLVYNQTRYKWLAVLLLVCAAFLIWDVKFFIAAALFATLLPWALLVFLQKYVLALKQTKWQLLAYIGLLALGFLLVMQAHPLFSEGLLWKEMAKNHGLLLERADGAPVALSQTPAPTALGMLQDAPQALFSTVFRPFLGESANFLWIIAGIENLLLALLLVLFLVKLIKQKDIHFPLLYLALLVYVVLTLTMLGLSTPTFGTLLRYRIAALPFLVLILVQQNWFRKWIT